MTENGSDVVLRVEGLRTYFFVRRGVLRAVDGVSFHVRRGEAFGLVGESGCGKTMTSLSLMRLVPAPAGRIVGGRVVLGGRDLLQLSEREMQRVRGKEISIVLQDPMSSLNPAFTIGDQTAEPIRLHQRLRGGALWQKVIESLKLVRIPAAEKRLGDYPHQMSGGQRQRVVGAIGLSCQPTLLIADEPTTALDVTVQAQYLELLREAQNRLQLSMVFITHDFGVVARMCDRVAVMYAGRIVETAGTRDLFDNPCHPYTKALLACIPKVQAEEQELATIDGQPPDLVNPHGHCRFAPRCTERIERCLQEYPPEVAVSENHQVSCWRGGSAAC
ncbi:MAG: ABC transporter ATP-binding protein [Chloroflexota bacterium]|nr:MAG: ABC transporter ATP-binding protein [Chloroflexota bacterium]